MKIEFNENAGMWFSLIFGFIIMSCIFLATSSEDVNSIINKHEFDFKGFVYAFPDKNHDKNYRLFADMYKEANGYYVSKIYFYNGGYIDFEEYGEPLDKKGSMACGYLEYVDEETNKDWCFRFYGEQIQAIYRKINRK